MARRTNDSTFAPAAFLLFGTVFTLLCITSIADSILTGSIQAAHPARCSVCGRDMRMVSDFENEIGQLKRYQCDCGRTAELAVQKQSGKVSWSERSPEDKARPE